MTGTPNAASVALFAGDEVLLIQRARAPFSGLWTLPGGRLEPGETAVQCAAREIGEELGLRVRQLRPVMQLPVGDARAHLLQVFATKTFEGEIAPSDEIAAWRWVRPDMAGRLATTPRLDEVLARAAESFNRR